MFGSVRLSAISEGDLCCGHLLSFLTASAFGNKRIKFSFSRDNGIKFNISARIKDEIILCRITG